MKKIIVIFLIFAAIAAAGVGGYRWHVGRADTRPREYEFAEVSRGTVERVIVSSGTLSPVGSVEVGTQVSGTVDKVHVDFNDTVRAGQVIAEIDRSVLLSRLEETQASFSRAEALFAQSEQEWKRGESLFEKGLISEQEVVKHRTDYHTQKASLQVAKAAVTTAQENVRYTTIRSPVRGTVISRSVEVGQTVAASLSAPTLFIIAEDLKHMKIMAQVDETDIGRIREAQEVRFTVQAYPDKNYSGSVSQVRLQPEVVQNVVTYTVVILADNHDGTLLPGMTANVEFVEARAEGELTVPMSVLRFKPPEDVVEMFKDAGDGSKSKILLTDGVPDVGADPRVRPMPPDGGDGKIRMRGDGDRGSPDGKARMRDGGAAGGRAGGDRMASLPKTKRGRDAPPGGRGVLWTVDSAGTFTPVYVKLGLNDGVKTVVYGRDDELREGMKIVSGEVKKDKDKPKKKGETKSLLPQGGGSGGPRRI